MRCDSRCGLRCDPLRFFRVRGTKYRSNKHSALVMLNNSKQRHEAPFGAWLGALSIAQEQWTQDRKRGVS